MKLLNATLLGATLLAVAICGPAVGDTVAAIAPIGDAAAVIPAPGFIPDWAKAIWYSIVTPFAISGVASMLSAALPQGQRGTVWGFVRKVIDAAAWNWGNAANEPKS